MRDDRWRLWIVLLLVMISLPAVLILMSRRSPAIAELKPRDNNPDKFYLFYATGNVRVIAFSFTYDPHEADAWMFRTAEGHLASGDSNHAPLAALAPKLATP